jgi:hypothetical protein
MFNEPIRGAQHLVYTADRMTLILNAIIKRKRFARGSVQGGVLNFARAFFTQAMKDMKRGYCLPGDTERRVAEAVLRKMNVTEREPHMRRLQKFLRDFESLNRPGVLTTEELERLTELRDFFSCFNRVAESQYDEMMRRSHAHLTG